METPGDFLSATPPTLEEKIKKVNVDEARSEERMRWITEVIRYVYDHPDLGMKQVASDMGRPLSWLQKLRTSEEWERAWITVGREKLMPAVPLAVKEVIAALDRGDSTATNLAVKILENTGLMKPDAEAEFGHIPNFVEVEISAEPTEPVWSPGRLAAPQVEYPEEDPEAPE